MFIKKGIWQNAVGSLVLGICLNLKKKRKRKERVEQDFLQMGGCLCDNSSML